MIIIRNREMLIPDNEMTIGTNYDAVSESRVFRINRFSQGGVDISGLTFRLDLEYESGDYDTLIMDKEIADEFVYITWTIPHSILQQPGTVKIQIRAIDDGAVVRWSTYQAAMFVDRHLNVPANYTGDLTEIEQMEQDHQYFKSVIQELEANIDYKRDAEAWAVGTRDGVAVPQTDETWHNNAKYYARYAGQTGVAQLSEIVSGQSAQIAQNAAEMDEISETVAQNASTINQTAADLESYWGVTKNNLASVETTDYASRAYAVGEYLVTKDGVLCRVTQAIASGARLVFGTNIQGTSIADELNNGYVETYSPVTGITFHRIGRVVTLRINGLAVTPNTTWTTIFNGVLTRFRPIGNVYIVGTSTNAAYAGVRITGTEIQYSGSLSSLYATATYIAQSDAGDTPFVVNTYALTISQGTGSTITVQRTASTRQGAALGNLANGAAIYTGDVLKITFGASSGYTLGTHTVNGATFASGGTVTVGSDVAVVSTATNSTITIYVRAVGVANPDSDEPDTAVPDRNFAFKVPSGKTWAQIAAGSVISASNNPGIYNSSGWSGHDYEFNAYLGDNTVSNWPYLVAARRQTHTAYRNHAMALYRGTTAAGTRQNATDTPVSGATYYCEPDMEYV